MRKFVLNFLKDKSLTFLRGMGSYRKDHYNPLFVRKAAGYSGKVRDKKFIQLCFVFVIIVTALGALSLFSFYSKKGSALSSFFKDRPAKLTIIKIVDSSCADCFDLENILKGVRSANVRVKSERTLDRGDEEARELIAKYSIGRLPTFIVQGEVRKNNELIALWKKFGNLSDDTFVFTRVFPPYVVGATGDVRGRFTIIYLTDINCGECYDVTKHNIALANLGLTVTAENSTALDVGSVEAKELIEKYKIEHAPTIILNGELNEYLPLVSIWPTVGTIEDDGAYVFRESGEGIMGAYKNLKTGEVLNEK